MVKYLSSYKSSFDDETLSNFIKRKHRRKGEKKKQGTRTKVQASKQPQRGGATRRKEREPLRTKPSTSCTKHFACLKILFNVNGKGHSVTHLLFALQWGRRGCLNFFLNLFLVWEVGRIVK
jgi:hypothetical protein